MGLRNLAEISILSCCLRKHELAFKRLFYWHKNSLLDDRWVPISYYVRTTMIDPHKPGNLAELNIKIPIRAGVLGLLASIGLAMTFYSLDKKPNERKTLEFITLAIGTSAGIASTFYVGQGIVLNAKSKKLDRTTVFISKWSDPEFNCVRKAGHDINAMTKDSLPEDHPDIIKKALDEDMDLKIRVLNALNFLEVMALCVHLGIIEETVIRQYYRSIVQTYCNMFGLWIARLRIERKNDQLFKHLTNFCDESREFCCDESRRS